MIVKHRGYFDGYRGNAVVLLVLLFSFLVVGLTHAGTIRVVPDPDNTPLTNAVRGAEAGDTILVSAGLYREKGISVTRPMTIIGHGMPVIDAENSGEILTIRASGVKVSGLEFRNIGTSFMEDRAAIKIVNAKDCVVEANRITNGFFGIYLENAENCRVSDNVVVGNAEREATSGNGIHAWHCRGITIENNKITGHRDGIYFEFVEDSRVQRNRSWQNLRYGLHFMFSHDTRYERNTFRSNGAGVAVMYSRNISMSRNQFERNRGAAAYGLLLKEIKDSQIIGNVFRLNTIGIYSEGSDRVEVTYNQFLENGYGVKIMANSTNNLYSSNNFVGNTFDVATNSKQNFNNFVSNYWSAYRGYDLDGDGIGDVAHHPVRLFALLVEKEPFGIILMNSLFVRIIDSAERVLPVFTPEALVDERPLVRMVDLKVWN
jgi:nitrous oxidase accessory protein